MVNGRMNKIDLKAVMDKVVQYRGVIITDSINIEKIMELIISNYFARKDRSNEFNRKVMDDEYFSFGLKIRILEKLNFEVYKEFFEDFRRINNIRNIFAHCIPGSFTGGLSYYNKKKKTHEVKELEEFHKEFLEKIKKVGPQLDKLFWKLVEENKKEAGTK